MIERLISKHIASHIDFKKAILLKGARQVGKTTLLKELLRDKTSVLWIDGDDPFDRNLWGNMTKDQLQLLIGDFKYLVFDEAQRISNIGLAAKMIVDTQHSKQVFLSGSSSLNLNSSINEPLTGRKWSFELYPLSWQEIVRALGFVPALRRLDEMLITGTYPEIFTTSEHKQKLLRELAGSYLYRDVLEYGGIRKPDLIFQLLQALAYQIGSEVSYHELARMLRVNHETISRYISLLEESYVIFRLIPWSSNLRKEITTTRKIYFYDNGIRNAIINNFSPPGIRSDMGLLWENFVVSEMHKKYAYKDIGARFYFWRSKSGAEIDLVLQTEQDLHAYEIKYRAGKKVRFAPSFLERYQPVSTAVIDRENFHREEFLG